MCVRRNHFISAHKAARFLLAWRVVVYRLAVSSEIEEGEKELKSPTTKQYHSRQTLQSKKKKKKRNFQLSFFLSQIQKSATGDMLHTVPVGTSVDKRHL